MRSASTIHSWESLRPDLLIEYGVDTTVANAVGMLAIRMAHYDSERGTISTSMGNLNHAIEAHKIALADLERQMAELTGQKRSERPSIVESTLGDSNITPVLEHVLSLTYESTPDELYERAKVASGIKAFNDRLEAEAGTPVLHVKATVLPSDFFLNVGRGSGQPVNIFEEQSPIQKSVIWKMLGVPTSGYVEGRVPSFATSTPELRQKHEVMKDYFPYFKSVQFLHDPTQLSSELDWHTTRTALLSKDLWLVGDDTVKELARLLALQDENMADNGWHFEHTRLEYVGRSGLLLLKNALGKAGIDIEEVPKVKARLDEWRFMVQRWALGDMSVEPSQEVAQGFNEFNGQHPQFDARPKFIGYIAESLAA